MKWIHALSRLVCYQGHGPNANGGIDTAGSMGSGKARNNPSTQSLLKDRSLNTMKKPASVGIDTHGAHGKTLGSSHVAHNTPRGENLNQLESSPRGLKFILPPSSDHIATSEHEERIYSDCWRSLPPEIVLSVVDSVINHHNNNVFDKVDRSLKTLSSVCSAWRERCAPGLFNWITVDTRDLDALYVCALVPGNPLRRYTRVVKLQRYDLHSGSMAIELQKLSRALPDVTELCIVANSRTATFGYQHPIDISQAYKTLHPSLLEEDGSQIESRFPHPSYFHILSGAFVTFANVSSMTLRNAKFPCVSDLLRILGALPSLKWLELRGVGTPSTKSSGVDSIPLRTNRKSSKLETIISIDNRSQLSALWGVELPMWPLLYYSTWPHIFSGNADKYVGLSRKEAQIVLCICTALLGTLQGGRVGFYLHPSLYPQTWVLTIITSGPSDWLDIEFHITQNPSLLSDASNLGESWTSTAWILWVTVRFVQDRSKYNLLGLRHNADMDAVGGYLRQLHHLRHVVAEHVDENIPGFDEQHAMIQALAETQEQGRVLSRTWRQSQEHAREARAKGVNALSESTLPVSPFWYPDVFAKDAMEKEDHVLRERRTLLTS